ncbi:MAG: hypothetical protein Ct9H90mP9_4160 [Pseudomonadota bacterium]|nr:MAG: hypothetical protein Ct9H90mP9_4160 [Pseudomonadota bacterium]
MILWKQLKHELTKFFVHPGFIRSIRLSGQKLDERLIQIAFAYFFLNILLVLAGACVMGMLNDIDFETAISSTISALMNIGPGFGAVGPTDNYHHLSEVSKWILSWLMLVGRLELFTALVIFYPSFWKKRLVITLMTPLEIKSRGGKRRGTAFSEFPFRCASSRSIRS